MIVKLTLLDRQPSLGYNTPVEVVLSGQGYEVIGTCKVFMDSEGHHFGELLLDRPVDDDRYFYYTNMVNNDGMFYFTGLNLTNFEVPDRPTTRLKEMIVSK